MARFLKKRPGKILKPEIGLHQNCTALQPGPGAPPHPGRCPWAAPIVKIWGENGRRRILFWRRRFFIWAQRFLNWAQRFLFFKLCHRCTKIIPPFYQNCTIVVRPSMWSSVWFFGASTNFLATFISFYEDCFGAAWVFNLGSAVFYLGWAVFNLGSTVFKFPWHKCMGGDPGRLLVLRCLCLGSGCH